MVDEEKVKVMTKLAIYENRDGKKELPLSKYYKRDYVKYNILKTMIFATISYWLIVAGIIVINMEKLLSKMNDINYIVVGYGLVIGYAVFLIIYAIITKIVYGKKYEKARSKIIVYNYLLKKLIKFYNENEKGIYNKMPIDLELEDGGEREDNDNIIKY